jgi:hypothetical protein
MDAPLLGGARPAGMARTAAFAIAGLAVAAVAAVVALSGHFRGVQLLSMPLPLLGRPGAPPGGGEQAHAARGELKKMPEDRMLYSDWRGTALEGVDSWSFTHKWEGNVDIHEREQTVVRQPTLELKARPVSPALSETTNTLRDSYSVSLAGAWKPAQAAALLDTLNDLCSKSAKAPHPPAENCNMKQATTWEIHDGRLPDDVQVQGGSVAVAARALDFSAPRSATLDGGEGTVVSRRLQFVVMRVVTDFGKNKEVVGQILKRRIGA